MVNIIHGDCLDEMRNIVDNSIRLVISSPPYCLNKTYEQDSNFLDYKHTMFSVCKEISRIVKDNGSVCWQVGNYVENGAIQPLDYFFYPIFTELGFKLRNRIIWRFGHGLHCSKRFSGRYETLLWFTKGDDYVFNLDPVRVPQKYPSKKYFKGPKKGQLSCNPLGCNPSDVWDIPNVKHNHIEKTDHPCQFPCELCERLILSLSNVGENICDPFCGSGTAGLASILHNRNFIGIEKEKKYVDITNERIQKHKNGEIVSREWGYEN